MIKPTRAVRRRFARAIFVLRETRGLDDTPRRAMAPPLTVVQDDKGSREWKPAEYEDEPTYSHLVEIAKTGRARCRRCVRDAALACATPKTPFRQIWRAVYRKMRVAASDPPSPRLALFDPQV